MKKSQRRIWFLCVALLLVFTTIFCVTSGSDKVAHADTYPIDEITDYCIPDSLSTYLASQKLTDTDGVVHNKYVLLADDATDMHNNVWYVYETFVLDENDNILSIGNFIYPKCVQLQGRLEIPGGVSNGVNAYTVNGVGYEAFKDTNAVGTLIVQGGVERIDMRAFHNAGVSSMDLPDSIFDLGNGCFGYNYNLTYVKLPNQLKKTGYQSFQYCIGLSKVTVPDGLEEFSAESFHHCESLGSIDIKNSVKEIAYKCFGHTGLTSISLNNVEVIGAQAFEHCYELASIDWGKCLFGGRLDYRTFYMCSSLTSISLPDNVKQVGTDCFNGCTGVSSIDLNSVQMLEYCAFANTGISKLEMPESLQLVGSFCFGNTSNLEKVIFHNDIRSFNMQNYQSGQLFIIFGKLTYNESSDQWNNDSGSWKNNIIKEIVVDNASITDCTNTPNGFCQYMEGIEKVTLSDNITTINYQSFYGCTSLETVNMSENVNAFQDEAFYNCSSLYQMNPTEESDFNIPSGMYWLGNSVFFQCKSLGDVTVGNTVQNVGTDCFYRSGVVNLVVEDCVTSIGLNAFKELSRLETIYIDVPASISQDRLYYQMFWDSKRLSKLTIGKNVASLDAQSCNFMYMDTLEFEDGSTITTIPTHCFFGCFYLDEVTLPSGLEAIGEEAFQQCYALDDITFPSTLKTVSRNAFFDCHSLKTVEGWENLEKIGDYAFFNNLSLEKVIIGENVNYLGQGSFFNTYALDELVLDNAFVSGDRTIIQSYMSSNVSPAMRLCRVFGRDDREFYHSTVMDYSKEDCLPEHNYFKLVISDKVEGIQMGEFENMYMDEVVFEENGKLTSIPTFAFQGNKYLSSVDLGNKVDTIGVSAFADCTELSKIELPLSVNKVEVGAFSNCIKLSELYVYNPDIVIEEYTDGELTHLEYSPTITVSKYKKNSYDICSAETVVLNFWIPVDRGDRSYNNAGFKDGAWYAFIPASWLVEESVAKSLTHNISVSDSTLVSDSEVEKKQYALFGELYPATYIKKTITYSLNSSESNIDFSTDDYMYDLVSSSVNGTQCDLDILVTPSNDTIPEYTDIYAYRYTKPNWSTEGYVPDEDIALYSETSPMEYIETYTRTGNLYPLDEIVSIEGAVSTPKQLKGVSYEEFGITVEGTRRDKKEFGVLGYTHNYDATDLTLGDRDVLLEYECPVSLVNGKPNDTVVVNLNDERKVTIQGSLKYSNSNPIANKTIRLVKSDLATYNMSQMFTLLSAGTPIVYETVTDDNGAFKFDGVAVGEYELQLYNDVAKNELLASVNIYVQNIYDNDDNKSDDMGVSEEADNVDTTLDITDDLFSVDAIMSIEDPDDTTEDTTEEETTESTTEEETTESTTEEDTTESTTEEETTESTTEEETTESTTEEETTESTTEEETTESTTEEEPDDGDPETGDKSNVDFVWLLLITAVLGVVCMVVEHKLSKDNTEL